MNLFPACEKNNFANISQWMKSFFEHSAVFIFCITIAYLTMDRAVNIYDEGIILTAAMRVAAGDVIHRDFYANYGPAEFYVVSWFFKLFGQNVFAERAFDLAVRAGISTLIYSALVYYSRQLIALIATAVCVVWLCAIDLHGYPIYPTVLLTIGSTLMMTKSISRSLTIWHPFCAGILTGLSALFRYDIGFFVLLAHVLSTILVVKLYKQGKNSILHETKNIIFPYVAGAGLPVITVLLLYFIHGALNSFFHDVVLFQIQYYARTRALPFPPFSSFFVGFGFISLAIYLPVITCVTAVVGTIGRQATNLVDSGRITEFKSSLNEKSVLVVLLTFSVAMLYLKGIVRVSVEHMQPALLPSIMLLAMLFETTKKDKIWFKGALSAIALLYLVTALFSGYKKLSHNQNLAISYLPNIVKSIASTENRYQTEQQDTSSDKQSTSLFFVDNDRADAIRFVKQNTEPDERFYVGLTRHDKIFVNDVSAYFMTERLPSTKWHHFDPGLQSSKKIQSAIITDLEKHKPTYIWLESTWNDINEPNDSAISSGIKILDEYIVKNYRLAKVFGHISIYQRKQ